jgi:hypothetical protein
MPEDADENVFINVPGDNRGALVRYFDDVESLARMTDINVGLIEELLRPGRGVKSELGIYTFMVSDSSIQQILFVASDMCERAALLEVRRKKVSGEDYE